MRIVLLVCALASTGCSTLNLFTGQDDFCRSMNSNLGPGFEEAVAREVAKEPPNGALTKAYSRELWDEYWNHRIYYVWDVGPEDCRGYQGPTGPELIRDALEKRRKAGLPEVNLEPRNLDKNI